MVEYTDEQRVLYRDLYGELYKCFDKSSDEFSQALEKAIKCGFPINDSRYGGELLTSLVISGRAKAAGMTESLLEILFAHGFDPNIKDDSGCGQIYTAITYHVPLSTINILISHGANIDLQNDNGERPFDQAAYQYVYGEYAFQPTYGRAAIKFLIKHGADLNLYKDWFDAVEDDSDEQIARHAKLKKLCEKCLE